MTRPPHCRTAAHPVSAAMEPRGRPPRPTTMKTHRFQTGIRHKAGAAAALGAVVVLAAACGSQTAAVGPSAQARSSLSITVTAAQGATPKHWILTCAPAGGNHPDAAAACAALTHVKSPFAPVSSHLMCSMIDSGPQTARITGTWEGKPVSATYSRTDGCQTARWNALEKVLGQVNPGGPMIPATSSNS
jgi:Subtilisin inhibitor-like